MDKNNIATTQEPTPVGDGTIVYEIVVQDMIERANMGKERYGTFLRTHNGRAALVDAYQELIDLIFYLRQYMLENEINPTDNNAVTERITSLENRVASLERQYDRMYSSLDMTRISMDVLSRRLIAVESRINIGE